MLTPYRAGFFIKNFLKQDPYKLATEVIVNFLKARHLRKGHAFALTKAMMFISITAMSFELGENCNDGCSWHEMH